VTTVSLVTTCINEEANIAEFLASIRAQTRRPDEVVIVDGGSSDRTAEMIRQAAASDPSLRLIEKPGNRSVGRNAAVAAATGPLIAMTDVGNRLDPHWLELLVAPLQGDESVGVVGGFYAADARTTMERAVAAATMPAASEVNPDTFLPSSRSIAFRKEFWRKAGGYPEDQWHNEDTPFDLRMKAAGARFVFEPRALVYWRPQGRLGRVYHQFWRYAVGDAQERLWFRHYAKAYALLVAVAALLVAGFFARAAWWGLPALALLYWLRYAARSKRRGYGWAASLLSPLVMAAVDAAHVVGYAAGKLRRA
jgi:glycosyltransferase involved in cell wall biosynthesis